MPDLDASSQISRELILKKIEGLEIFRAKTYYNDHGFRIGKFIVTVRKDRNGFAIQDEGSSKTIIEFNFDEGGHARLISENGKTFLYRKPYSRHLPKKEVITHFHDDDDFGLKRVEDKELILVGEINAGDFFSQLESFAQRWHNLRSSLTAAKGGQLPQEVSSNFDESLCGEAISTGPCAGGERRSTVWSAKHSPIVKALAEQLKGRGWTICSGNHQTIPDLVVEKKFGTKILRVMFEIKPDFQTHNLLCALGQSILYREDWKAHRAIVIALSDQAVECSDLITKVFDNQKVEIVRTSNARGEPFSFSDFYFHFEYGDKLVLTKTG